MIKEKLTVPNKNILNTFLPLRTKDIHYKFCWDTVLGYFVHILYGKSLPKGGVGDFKALCEKRFADKLDEPDFWPVLEKMYFEKDQLFKVSPELLIFKALKNDIGSNSQKTAEKQGSFLDNNSKKLADMLGNLLCGQTLESSSEKKLNFLEKEIKAEFDTCFETSKPKKNVNLELEYLPFLSELFRKDLRFLNKRPQYLLNNFNAVIRLYIFLYFSQMSLNIKDWANGAPTNKPCFFIVDNEKASDERSQVKNFGYNQLHDYLGYLFPYLCMNEAIQPKGQVKPLWQTFETITDNDIIKLNQFGSKFTEDRTHRKLYNVDQHWVNSNEKQEVLNQLLNIAHAQFNPKKGRLAEYNDTAVKGTLRNILDPFIQRRGRAGQVLTFNQDYIVLLTNLAIGEREKLRFHEVIKEFKSRGVFFDKQSQECLINFYERMGNVERMSDSGDAVYVRKTV